MASTNNSKNVLLLFSASWMGAPYQLTELEEFRVLAADLDFTRRQSASLDEKNLATVLALVRSGKLDAIVADAPMIVVLQAHLRRLGLPRIPCLVISPETDSRVLETFAALVSTGPGDDPMGDMIRARDIFWSSSTRGHHDAHLARGISAERMVHMPFCTFLRNLCNPASREWYSRPDLVDADTVDRVKGRVLASGIFNRDFVTFLHACGSLEPSPVILTDMSRLREALPEAEVHHFQEELARAPNVECLFASPHTYIACLRAAAVVVVPLFCPDFTSGHFTFADAQALGRPVVAADYPAAHDFIEDGKSGLLYAPRNAASLRKQLTRLREDPALAQAIALEGQHAEARLSDATRAALLTTLRRLLSP